jgi:hypothetical protein
VSEQLDDVLTGASHLFHSFNTLLLVDPRPVYNPDTPQRSPKQKNIFEKATTTLFSRSLITKRIEKALHPPLHFSRNRLILLELDSGIEYLHSDPSYVAKLADTNLNRGVRRHEIKEIQQQQQPALC